MSKESDENLACLTDMESSLRDRIEAVLWDNFDDAAPSLSIREMAEAMISELGLRMQYENGRVMYNYKPAACKANGNWRQRIVSDHELYTG